MYRRSTKRPSAESLEVGTIVAYESGSNQSWIVGPIVEVVPESTRPQSPIRVASLRDHESYVIEGAAYVHGVLRNDAQLYWPRARQLFHVDPFEAPP